MIDYSTAFTVPQTPAEAFKAILNVRGWWSANIDGPTDQQGAEFTYRYQHLHYTRQVISELVPDSHVTWDILDAKLTHADPEDEWNGTQVRIEVAPVADGTEVRFSHHGLTPELECYDNCSAAWSFYVNTSLRNLILSGVGGPNPAE